MDDIAVWLSSLGLEKYARVFEENEITHAALPELTEVDLKEMGLPIGPRRIVLKAARELVAESGLNLVTSAGTSGAVPSTAPHHEAERRQISILFCDLVDSTVLATKLDPEDLRTLLSAYLKPVATTVERFGGYVAQYLGDGVMAYFGWPTAHEDDAVRAVRAAIDIVKAVPLVDTEDPLQVRIGIATGSVVIGEAEPDDAAAPKLAIGETPNIAARVQGLAKANQIVIADSTRRLTAGSFTYENLGGQQLKGVIDPVQVWRVTGLALTAGRFEATRGFHLTPLVGRDEEIDLIIRHWNMVKEEGGQVLLVSGEPGIGKSRITQEVLRRVAGEPHTRLRYQCSPYFMNSALYPISEQIERVAEITGRDTAETKLQKLEKLIAQAVEDVRPVVPMFAALLSIELSNRYPALELTPEQQKELTFEALVNQALGLATKRPVLMILEDAQWIDPTTQEAFDLLIPRIADHRVLLIITHRPEFQPSWTGLDHVVPITLTRLGRLQVTTMIKRLTSGVPISNEIISQIVAKTDGIPLFVEELTRGVIDAGVLDEHGAGIDLGDPRGTASIPETLRDSLMARLDLAPQGRRVAQTAAVIGRDFSYDLLQRVLSINDSELRSSLSHLEESRIVQKIDNRLPTRYAFWHALLRDVAYESLLKTISRQIHAKVAETMKNDFPDIAANRPELLAHHYSLAGNAEMAVRYWLSGGERAQNRSAYLEAISQLQKALEFLEFLPDTRAHRVTRLEANLSLGLCFIAARGYAADDTKIAFECARALSHELGDSSKEIQAIFGEWGHHWMRAQHDRAIELGEMLLAKAEELDDPVSQVVAHRSLGSTLFTLGEFVLAREHLEQAISLSRHVYTEDLSLSFAVDPQIASRLMLAWLLWILGYPDQALTNVEQALEEAIDHARPYSVAFAHYVTSAVHLLRGEPQESAWHAERSIALSAEHRINLYALYSRFGVGCALAKMDQAEKGLPEIEAGIAEARRSNLGYMQPFMLGWLATVQAEIGDKKVALTTIDDALKWINDVSGRAWEAEVRRLRGDILLAVRPDALDDAESSHTEAIAVAQRQSARSLELRAAISLARLWQTQGKTKEAHDLLAPVYHWFTEGFDTADLQDAKALLNKLSGG